MDRAEIKFELAKLNLTQAVLAKKWRKPRATISQMIAGRLADTPRNRRLKARLAAVLDRLVDEVFDVNSR